MNDFTDLALWKLNASELESLEVPALLPTGFYTACDSRFQVLISPLTSAVWFSPAVAVSSAKSQTRQSLGITISIHNQAT